jgi:hypothetical protein
MTDEEAKKGAEMIEVDKENFCCDICTENGKLFSGPAGLLADSFLQNKPFVDPDFLTADRRKFRREIIRPNIQGLPSVI